MSSLRQKTVSGVLWSSLAKLSMQLVLLVVTTILARLLSKDDFGVVGMAALITVAIGMVNDKGLGMSIVQKKEVLPGQLSTMFWGSIGFGVLLYVLSFAASFPLALFFQKPEVQPIVTVIALGFVIGAFGIVQKSILTREMSFKALSIVEIVAVLTSGAVAVVMALTGFGVWSLVVNVIGRDLFTVIGLWFVCTWRPYLHFRWTEFREYLRFSSNVLANDGAIYLITNADITIIGRVLGSAALGVYNLALYLVKLPVTRISGIVAKVVFPAFSSVQDDLEAFKKAYLRAIKFISILTFPILAGLAVFSREFIMVILGEKWLEMVWPLIFLTPMAMLKSVGTIKGSVLMAVGRPDIEMKWNLVYLVPLVAVVYFGTRFGLVGVAIAFTALYVITFPIIQQITNKQILVTWPQFLKAVRTSSVATLVMVAAGIGIRFLSNTFLLFPPIVVLIIGPLMSAVIYMGTIWLLDKQIYFDFKSMMRKTTKTESTLELSEAVIPS